MLGGGVISKGGGAVLGGGVISKGEGQCLGVE